MQVSDTFAQMREMSDDEEMNFKNPSDIISLCFYILQVETKQTKNKHLFNSTSLAIKTHWV